MFFCPIQEPTVPIAMYTWKWVLQNNVPNSDLIRAQSKSKRMLLPVTGARLKPWLLLCICLSLTIYSTALLVLAKSHYVISSTQQKEHPLDSTISCFSRYITRIWPTWFYWPIYNSQKPLVVPSQNWKTARSLLFPRPKSVSSTLTFLNTICHILRSCQEKWVIPWNSFGIPLDPNYTKLSFRWFQPLFQIFAAASKKHTCFHIMKFPHLQAPSHEDSVSFRRSFTKMKDKASWKNPPYIEWKSGKSLWKNPLESPSNLFANWKLCQQCFIHFFWKKCKLILIRLDNLLLSREHLCKDYLLVPKRLTCFKQKKR